MNREAMKSYVNRLMKDNTLSDKIDSALKLDLSSNIEIGITELNIIWSRIFDKDVNISNDDSEISFLHELDFDEDVSKYMLDRLGIGALFCGFYDIYSLYVDTHYNLYGVQEGSEVIEVVKFGNDLIEGIYNICHNIKLSRNLYHF